MTAHAHRTPRLLAPLALALISVACGDDQAADGPGEPLVAFDTGAVVMETTTDTFRVPVELALTEDQRAYGLMERSSLPEEWGMLFAYPEPADSTAGFWMYRTWIPLDVALLDADGLILDIQSMEPCESPNPRVCRLYGLDVPFVAALEANQGFFASRGVSPGDRVRRVE